MCRSKRAKTSKEGRSHRLRAGKQPKVQWNPEWRQEQQAEACGDAASPWHVKVLWQSQNKDRGVAPLTLDSEFSILYPHVHLHERRENTGGNRQGKSESLRDGTPIILLPQSLNHTESVGGDHTSHSPFRTL